MRPVRLHTSCGCNGRNACMCCRVRSGCRPLDTLCERRQLDLCFGRAAPRHPTSWGDGEQLWSPAIRCAAASGPRTHALSASSYALLTRCGAPIRGRRHLYVRFEARRRPRADRLRHRHQRRCHRCRRRRHRSPRVRCMRLRSSRTYVRVTDVGCDGHVV